MYETNRLGKQFGQFWIMDRHNNETLSRSLISIQVHVLKDIICNTTSEIIVENRADHSNASRIRLKQSINITVQLNPNCLLIEPQDQTITELSTLCTNNQPIVQANGGIQVLFECSPSLCEKYQICFVGEFGIKLPSTEIKCFSVEVFGTRMLSNTLCKNKYFEFFLLLNVCTDSILIYFFVEDECTHAINNNSFLRPHDRHFIIAEPITIQSTTVSTTKSKSKVAKTMTALQQSTSVIILSPKSKSRKWLWILAVLIGFTLAGFLSYFGFKQKLMKFMRLSLDSDRTLLSSRSDSSTTLASDMPPIYPNTKQISSPNSQPSSYDNSPRSPKRTKIRSQHIRLGALEEDD